MYTVYYDKEASLMFSESIDEDIRNANKLNNTGAMGLGYKGIVKVGDDNTTQSNQIRLSSVPIGEIPICNIIYNKDAYTIHCKEYKEYQHWLETRNEARYVETQSHGQRIDSKNMMHCIRLIRMAKEIGAGLGICVRRNDASELLAIRRGELDLDALLEQADKEINEMDTLFDNSNLPDSVDMELINNLLITIRKQFYIWN